MIFHERGKDKIDYGQSENHCPETLGTIIKALQGARTQKQVKSNNFLDLKGQFKRFLDPDSVNVNIL